MKILGIETSCDETAAAVVKDGQDILSNVVVSSLKEHQKYGGIIPEIASRRQLECINTIVDQALAEAKVSLKKIDAIAVTKTPGLIGSLLVGNAFAEALSYASKKPLIHVDHIQAHIYACFLSSKKHKLKHRPQLPAIGLVVSGGHTSLFQIPAFNKFKLIGSTRDDAAGEAFDKVARILELGYPGGPVIDRLAKSGKNSQIRFTSAQLPGTLDFSFSGIKTAVLYHRQKNKNSPVEQVAYSFQDSVVNVLTKKSIAACLKYKSKTLLIGGGVAANSQLRQNIEEQTKANNIRAYFPPLELCLDNAAMIAGFACAQRKNTN